MTGAPLEGQGWRAQEIAPGAWFVRRGWLNGNHFVAPGPAPLLIDSGLGADVAVTLAALAGLGVAPESVATILNSHCHPDHTGGNAELHRRSGCAIRMAAVAAARIAAQDAIATCWGFYDTQLWGEWGPVHGVIAPGEIFRFGALELEALPAPGHSLGQMVFWAARERILFSADALWHGDFGIVNPLIDGDDALERTRETLNTLLRLEIETVYPGHGAPFAKPGPGILRCLKKLEAFAAAPARMHEEHVRKSITYLLLNRGGMAEAELFDHLMASPWFPRLVDRYLGGDHRGVYEEALKGVLRGRMAERRDGRLIALGDR